MRLATRETAYICVDEITTNHNILSLLTSKWHNMWPYFISVYLSAGSHTISIASVIFNTVTHL